MQSTGRIVHVVPQSAEVYQVHSLAQLQMGYSEGYRRDWTACTFAPVLLCNTRLLGEKDLGRLRMPLVAIYSIILPFSARREQYKDMCNRVATLLRFTKSM